MQTAKIVFVAVALTLGLIVFSLVMRGCNTAQGVIGKTMEPTNVITTYEWYFDVEAQYKARVNQVRQFEGFLKKETDSQEITYLRVEMAAQQQSCRELAQTYNAESRKINKKLFKGWSLPPTLDSAPCEVY